MTNSQINLRNMVIARTVAARQRFAEEAAAEEAKAATSNENKVTNTLENMEREHATIRFLAKQTGPLSKQMIGRLLDLEVAIAKAKGLPPFGESEEFQMWRRKAGLCVSSNRSRVLV